MSVLGISFVFVPLRRINIGLILKHFRLIRINNSKLQLDYPEVF